MHRRLQRVFLAATMTCALLAPAVGSAAGPQEELDDTQDRLESLREQIEDHQSQAGGLRDRIDGLNADITKLQIMINKLDGRIAEVQAEVRAVQAEIDGTKGKIAKIETAAVKQATALYKSGSTEPLDAILNTKSISELNDRLEMLGVAAQENTDVLIRFGRLKALLQEQNQDLFERQQVLTETRNTQEEVLAQRDSLRDRLATDLNTLQEKLGSERAREGDLAAKAADLEDEIAAAQAAAAPVSSVSSAASLGTSAAGFIWPLNGSVTSPFGYRWGRAHTGIDIDGVSGQPIVASKAGRVIMAGAYGGYGNAVIVDHGSGISTLYAHMSSFATSSGSSVGQGQTIGYVGCTGSCTGDHLHFEVRVNGSPVDPMGYLP